MTMEPTMSHVDEHVLQNLIDEISVFSTQYVAGFGRYQRGLDEELTEEDIDLFQKYAGLAVLIRDMDQYLKKRKRRDDGAIFERILQPLIKINKENYPAQTIFRPRPQTELPGGFAKAAAKGEPMVKGLDDPTIVHEWTVKPGKQFFLTLAGELKEIICKAHKEAMDGLRDPRVVVAVSMLCSGFSPDTFWYPLVAFLAVLIVIRGLDSFCDDALAP